MIIISVMWFEALLHVSNQRSTDDPNEPPEPFINHKFFIFLKS